METKQGVLIGRPDKPESFKTLFPYGVEPLVVNGDPGHQSVGWRRVDNKVYLVAVDRPGEGLRVLETDVHRIKAVTSDGQTWVVGRLDGSTEVVNAAGGHSSLNLETERYSYFDAVWSPDGKWLALFAKLPGAHGFILYDRSGKERYRATEPFRGYQVLSESIHWSVDGEELLFDTYSTPIELSKASRLHRFRIGEMRLESWHVRATSGARLNEVRWVK